MKSKVAGIYFKIMGRDNEKTNTRELYKIYILWMMEHGSALWYP
jgi:hypothetical protein